MSSVVLDVDPRYFNGDIGSLIDNLHGEGFPPRASCSGSRKIFQPLEYCRCLTHTMENQGRSGLVRRSGREKGAMALRTLMSGVVPQTGQSSGYQRALLGDKKAAMRYGR